MRWRGGQPYAPRHHTHTAVIASVALVAPAGAGAAQQATTITVTAGKPTEFGFKLSKTRVPKGVVVFTVKNMGAIQHDFKIAGKKTKNLNPGQTASLTVTFSKPGKQAYMCTVTGHAAAGMKGTFTVK